VGLVCQLCISFVSMWVSFVRMKMKFAPHPPQVSFVSCGSLLSVCGSLLSECKLNALRIRRRSLLSVNGSLWSVCRPLSQFFVSVWVSFVSMWVSFVKIQLKCTVHPSQVSFVSVWVSFVILGVSLLSVWVSLSL